jgi:hypothetical protein
MCILRTVTASSGEKSERDNMCVERGRRVGREEERGGEAIPRGTSLTLPITQHHYLTHGKEQFVGCERMTRVLFALASNDHESNQ